MAKHTPPDVEAATEAQPKKGRELMTLIKAIAFVSVIVVLEVGAGAMFFPTAEETKAVGEKLAQAGKEPGEEAPDHKHATEGAHGSAEHGVHTRESNLGTYHIVSYNPKTNKSLSVDFELFGVLLAEEEHEFTELYTVHEKRINEQVTIAVRGMEVADFTDPGLALIKRVILEKTNRALGKPLVREIIVSQFSFLER